MLQLLCKHATTISLQINRLQAGGSHLEHHEINSGSLRSYSRVYSQIYYCCNNCDIEIRLLIDRSTHLAGIASDLQPPRRLSCLSLAPVAAAAVAPPLFPECSPYNVASYPDFVINFNSKQ